MTSTPGGATERPDKLSDDQIMSVLRAVAGDELFRMLTFKRWKDGIDIDYPTFAAQRLAAEFRASPDSKLEAYEEALHQIDNWSAAYPLDIFPEPDMAKAAALLKAGGMTVDAISAKAVRHVVEGVGKIARKALAAGG